MMQLLKLNLKNKNFKIKQLYKGRLNELGGRNNQGHITVRHRGGGVKKLERLINFRYLLWGIKAVVLSVEYGVKRSGFLNLICYSNGILSYILATEGVTVGSILNIGLASKYNSINDYQKGSVLPLKLLIDGLFIHSLEVDYLKGANIARSAGTSAQVVKVNYTENKSLIKLPSGEERLVDHDCIATIGQVSNSKHFLKKLRKAGQKRNLGFRSSVRGVAMNPVDHPHGGGEGRTSGAGGYRSQVTFKGLPAKGVKTRSSKKNSSYILTYRKKIK